MIQTLNPKPVRVSVWVSENWALQQVPAIPRARIVGDTYS